VTTPTRQAPAVTRPPATGGTRRRTIPTLIPFLGRPPAYLGIALQSAADFNERVVLIGDDANRGFWKDHWDGGGATLPKWEEFKRVHVKMSDYSDFFETANWHRAFAVEEWMKREGVDQVFILDGDTVTFADYAKVVAPAVPSGCQAALMTYRDQDRLDLTTSLHFSWWTLEALADFTSFCIAGYRDPAIRGRLEAKYRWHLENRLPGGICEMTLLHLWRERNEKATWNAAKVWDGAVADLAITTSNNYVKDEYVMRRGFKKLVFRGGLPYGFDRALGKEIKFVNVQCQGIAKALMRPLYTPGWRRVYADVYWLRRLIAKAGIRSSVKAALRSVLAGSRSAR
jgi:hypothetical protein